MDITIVIREFERLAAAAIEHDDNTMSLEWHLHLLGLAFGIEAEDRMVVIGKFFTHEPRRKTSFLNAQVAPKTKISIRSRKSFHLKHEHMSNTLYDEKNIGMLKICPKLGIPRDNDGKASTRRTFSHGTSSGDSQSGSIDGIVTADDVTRWLLQISRAYRRIGDNVLAFNTAQICLLHTGFPTVPVKNSKSFFVGQFVAPLLMKRRLRKVFKSKRSSKIFCIARDAYAAADRALESYFANSMQDDYENMDVILAAKAHDACNTLLNESKRLMLAARIGNVFNAAVKKANDGKNDTRDDSNTTKNDTVQSAPASRGKRFAMATKRLILFRRKK